MKLPRDIRAGERGEELYHHLSVALPRAERPNGGIQFVYLGAVILMMDSRGCSATDGRIWWRP